MSSRLLLGAPRHASVRPWALRAVDLDPYEHVNNASQWAILEEVLPPGRGPGTAELEHVLPVDTGTSVELHVEDGDGDAGCSAWLVGGGRVHTAARWRPDPSVRCRHAAGR